MRIILLLTLFLLLQESLSSKEAKALRIDGDININGKLSEEFWQYAEPATGFIQKDPIQGAEPSQKTDVYFLYDDNNLYIGARMHRDDPETIQAYVARRDNMGNSERIIISLDTFCDKKTSYSFAITATGVRADYYHSADHEGVRDYTYDPVWTGKTHIDSAGWTAEIEIPFSQLRFNDSDNIEFGLNCNQWTPGNREDTYWVMIPRSESGWASRFGKLTGITDVSSNRGLEIMPYVTGKANHNNDIEAGNPFAKEFDTDFTAGLDLKYGISSNMTLDATINPDFGQVEADPAEVNLTAFETFFPEKRPFFLEKRTLFDGYGSSYFYSRRIGDSPRNFPHNADYIEVPDFTRILGAAKLTGRTRNGLSLGGLTSVTQSSFANVYFAENDSTSEILIEPLTSYNVLRMEQEFGEAANSVGFIVTGVERDLDNNEFLSQHFNQRAYTGGGDYYFTFDNRNYELQGHLGGSYVEGSPEKMLLLQRSPVHYYQRPDASHVGIDSNATNLLGYAGSLKFNKISGEHWLFNTTLWFESPGFELNDIGSLSRADNIAYNASIKYRETRSSDALHSYDIILAMGNSWNFEGIKKATSLQLASNINFINRSSLNAYIKYYTDGISDTKTRGGPLMAIPQTIESNIAYSSDWTRELTWSGSLYYVADKLKAHKFNTDASLAYNRGRVRTQLTLSYRNINDPLQYVTTKNRTDQSITYGNRYIFGIINREEFATALRFDYAFTPDLTLELYAEPFISVGEYTGYSELKAARSYELLTYGTEGTTITKNDDGGYQVTDGNESFTLRDNSFDYLSFRSNFVLRWEWARGSTLFFVWQQDRSRFDDISYRSTADHFSDIFELSGINTIALKISYWLPVN